MSRRRFTKDEWIALGLRELADRGCDAVKLEAICKAASLTRGSFYHHFADHETFLTALALQWLTTQTEEVAATLDPEATVAEQSAALTEAAMQIDYRLELGIRELGRRIPAVSEIIREADAMRLRLISTLYQMRFNIAPDRADQFAYLEYAAFSGIILLNPDIAEDRQQALADLFEATVTRALTSEDRS